MISACILIRTEKNRFQEVVDRVKQFREVNRVFSVLGRFDAVADVESENYESLANIVLRIGQIGGIVFTETLTEVKR
jgi:uncharacterized protein with GYD domain